MSSLFRYTTLIAFLVVGLSPLLYGQEPSEQIAFVIVTDSGEDIFIAPVDGGPATNLTNTTSRDYHPTWSPDGRRIAFTSNRTGDDDIYIMQADGSNPQNLTVTQGANESAPAWSPDGQWIAFASDRDGGVDLYRLNVATGQIQRLTDDAVPKSAPAWSPDGTKIVYWTTRRNSTQIFIIDMQTRSRRILVENGPVDWPVWSPDGMRIAYHTTRSGSGEIAVYNLQTERETILTDPDDGFNDLRPEWSPDGQRLVFMSDRGGAFALYTMAADGSDVRPTFAVSGQVVHSPAWQPVARTVTGTSDTAMGQGTLRTRLNQINPDSQRPLGESRLTLQHPPMAQLDEIIIVRLDLDLLADDADLPTPVPNPDMTQDIRQNTAFQFMGAELRGFDLEHFDVLPNDNDYLVRVRADETNRWEWRLRPKASATLQSNWLSVLLFAPQFFEDGSMAQEEIEDFVFEIEVVTQRQPQVPPDPMTRPDTEAAATGMRNTPQLLRVMADRDSVTLYTLSDVNIAGIRLRTTRGEMDMSVFDVLQALNFQASAGMCFRYIAPGPLSGAPPSVCQPGQTFSFTVNRADVFWFDAFQRRLTDLTLWRGDEMFGVCPATLHICEY